MESHQIDTYLRIILYHYYKTEEVKISKRGTGFSTKGSRILKIIDC